MLFILSVMLLIPKIEQFNRVLAKKYRAGMKSDMGREKGN